MRSLTPRKILRAGGVLRLSAARRPPAATPPAAFPVGAPNVSSGFPNFEPGINEVGVTTKGRPHYDEVNIGTGGPPSVGLKTRRTAWPILIRSRSQSTMLVI